MLFVRYLTSSAGQLAQVTHPVVHAATPLEAVEHVLRFNPITPEVEVWDAPGPPTVIRVKPELTDAHAAAWNTQTPEA